jgi:ubiquinone/menaquinone biosynthesis C-methylase UbiE
VGVTDPREHARRVAAVFDRVAEGYDSPAMRYFPLAADRLAVKLKPAPGHKVLDVCAGTGAVTLALAQMVGPRGRISAIDLSEAMLARLEEKRVKLGIENIDVYVMDAACPEFRSGCFDHVVSSFGIFFMPDMVSALREWVRVLRPGGQVLFTTFAASAFEPYLTMFFDRLQALGVPRPPADSPVRQLHDPEAGRRLAEAAGLTDVQVATEQLGHDLHRVLDWWEIVWYSGLRNYVQGLSPEALETFRSAHLAELESRAGPDGLRLDVPVHFVQGVKPSQDGSKI